jgi:DNA-binding transcriptional LysR family regulator
VESRPLRYFVAVAEDLNFTRAADRLGISAPPLSRAIRQLETELGVTLFERTTHQVTLTPAGHVLLEEARTALDALQAAARRTQRAAATEPKVVLAVKADSDAGLLDEILARYATDPAAVPVAVRLCGWGEQPDLLRRGEADVALIHEWFDNTGLDTELVAVESSVAAVPVGHPLARQVGGVGLPVGLGADPFAVESSVAAVPVGHPLARQVGGVRQPAGPGADPVADDVPASSAVAPRPLADQPTDPPTDPPAVGVRMADLGLPVRSRDIHDHLARMVRQYDIRDLSQLLKLVELGEITTVLPASVVTRYPRPGVEYLPVVDAPPVTLVVAWPQQSRSMAAAALVRAAVSSGSAAGYDRA